MARSIRLLLLCTLAACGNVQSSLVDAPPVQVTLTVTHSGMGTGSVVSAPTGINCGTSCTLTVATGTSVTLTAAPDANSVFTGWTGGGCSGTSTCVVTVTDDTSVDAGFAKMQVNVTVTPGGNGTGTVTSAPAGIDCGSTCTSKFDTGTQITLTASPDASSTFLGWTGGGCDGTTAPCTFTATADTTVKAAFALNDSLVVTLAGNGVGTVTSNDAHINCGTSCSFQYSPNTMVTLTAAAGTESVFAGWSGGGCSGTGTCMVTINAATQVTATFNLKQYTLTVTPAGNGSGSVTSNPAGVNCGATCSADFDSGTMVTLTATPGVGSTFAGWSGGGCSGTSTCQVTMTAATAVTATFTLQQEVLTVTNSGNGTGTVTSNPAGISCGANCSAGFNYGTSVTLTASPATGTTFTGWSGGGCSGTGSCIVSMTAATAVTATFTLQQYTLTVVDAGNGSGTVTSNVGGINCGASCSATYNYGTMVTLTATPAAGTNFASWSGGGCSGTGTCTTTVNAATTVTATFTLQTYTLTVVKAGSGTGTVTGGTINCGASCAQTVTYGTMITLTASPATGSTFVGWAGGGCSGTGTCSVTVTAATMVTATFNLIPETLSVTLAGNGAGTVTSNPAGISCGATCSAMYNYGTVVTLSAAPSTGSSFTGWSGGGCSGTGTCAVTMTAATSVTATFALQTFTLSVTKNGTGTGTVTSNVGGINCGGTCSATINYGTAVTLTATPAAGSIFAGWSGGGCSGTGTCMVTVTAATAVTATFTQQFTLTVVQSNMGGGAGTVTSFPAGIACGATCAASFNGGTSVTLLADPANGSSFIGWSGGGCGASSPVCRVTVNAATTVTAIFSNVGVYYGMDNLGNLYRFDPSTYAPTTIGSLGTTFSFGDATYDTANSTLYMVDGRGSQALWTVNLSTGAATEVGVYGVTDVFAVGYYPPNNTLYCVGGDKILRTLNPTTGAATAVGTGIGTTTGSIEALIWDSKRSQFIGVTSGTNNLYTINVANGTGTLIAGVPAGSSNDLGAAYDSVTDKYEIFDFNGNVYQYDPANGYARTTPKTGLSDMAAVAYIGPHGGMHAIDGSGNVFAVDSTSLAETTVGNVGVTFSFGDMAWDPTNSTMYMVDGRGAKSLYKLNMATGAATLIGAHNVTDMFAIGYDPQNDTLYGVGGDNILRSISTATGAATAIGGAMGTSGSIESIYYDYRRNVLVGNTAGSTNLYSLNVAAGTATLISAEPSTNDLGGFYDAYLDDYWAWDYNGNFYRYNPESAYASTTVATGKGNIVAASITP